MRLPCLAALILSSYLVSYLTSAVTQKNVCETPQGKIPCPD